MAPPLWVYSAGKKMRQRGGVKGGALRVIEISCEIKLEGLKFQCLFVRRSDRPKSYIMHNFSVFAFLGYSCRCTTILNIFAPKKRVEISVFPAREWCILMLSS